MYQSTNTNNIDRQLITKNRQQYTYINKQYEVSNNTINNYHNNNNGATPHPSTHSTRDADRRRGSEVKVDKEGKDRKELKYQQQKYQSQHQQYQQYQPKNQPKNQQHYQNYQHHHSPSGSSSAAPRRRTTPSAVAAFDKDVYLHAHYHFLLSADCIVNEYTGGSGSTVKSSGDPDALVNWHNVECVITSVDSISLCPICLDQPVAAKITKCGHIFCYPCILHYLSLSSHSWARCPLCFEPVYPSALKSVAFTVHQRYTIGDQIQFTLLQRQKHSLVLREVIPAQIEDSNACHPLSTLHHNSTTDPTLFTRITYCSDIFAICQRELIELSLAANQSINDEIHYQYILIAEQAVSERLERWNEQHPSHHQEIKHLLATTQSQQEKREQEARDMKIKMQIKEAEALSKKKSKSRIDLEDELTWPELSSSPPTRSTPAKKAILSLTPIKPITPSKDDGDSKETKVEEGTNAASTATSSRLPSANTSAIAVPHIPSSLPFDPSAYYFYQSRDGQQIYLHSLCFRSLLIEYGGIAHLPAQLTGTVRYSDSYTVESQIRDKFRFLGHLPKTAAFSLVLVDLKDVVSQSTVVSMGGEYAAEINMREKRRQQQKQINRRKQQHILYEQQYLQDEVLSLNDAIQHTDTVTVTGSDLNQFPVLISKPDSPVLASTSPPKQLHWNHIAEKGMAASEAWAPLAHSPSQDQRAGSSDKKAHKKNRVFVPLSLHG